MLRSDDIVRDGISLCKERIAHKSFPAKESLYALQLAAGQEVLALLPSRHNRAVDAWTGIRLDISHVLTFL
ncbi:hypothetical protein [Collimonas pratensis]|uniref:hypothetical protein n=1 Tax=Collimonas pratensis TaxID=279113 RepID=UPI0007814EB9|nr:hypothetical protein [Collimonas pratensis]